MTTIIGLVCIYVVVITAAFFSKKFQ